MQRGVRGSEARHTTTVQYYRDLKRQAGELETGVQQLQIEKAAKAGKKRNQYGKAGGCQNGSENRPYCKSKFSFGWGRNLRVETGE